MDAMKIPEKITDVCAAIYANLEKGVERIAKRRESKEEEISTRMKDFLMEAYEQQIEKLETEKRLRELLSPNLDEEIYKKCKVLAYFLRGEDPNRIKEILGKDEYKELSLVYCGKFEDESVVLCFGYLPDFGDEGKYRKKIGAALNELGASLQRFMAINMSEKKDYIGMLKSLRKEKKYLEHSGPKELEVLLRDNFY